MRRRKKPSDAIVCTVRQAPCTAIDSPIDEGPPSHARRHAKPRARSTRFARGQRSRRLDDAREHARGVLRRARVAKPGPVS